MKSLGKIPLDPSARRPVAGSAVLLGLALLSPWPLLALPPAALLGLYLFFFRDPDRRPPGDSRMFVSPADGRVIRIAGSGEGEAGRGEGACVSIFLAVWNVHVNRAPHDGAVENVVYVPGCHWTASAPAAAGNESNWLFFRNGDCRFAVRQVAGRVARRILCRVRAGEKVRKGQRIGIIRFGSRTDLYLPAGCRILVREGDKVRGGCTPVALLPGSGSGAAS